MNGFHSYEPSWPELDTSLLEDARGGVPSFPLDVLPLQWRRWVDDTAQAAGTPADYVVLALFAAVAALSGAGVRIRVTPSWSESLVLWLALVGSPSSGKSPALASVRAQLADIEDGVRADDGVPPPASRRASSRRRGWRASAGRRSAGPPTSWAAACPSVPKARTSTSLSCRARSWSPMPRWKRWPTWWRAIRAA